VCLHAVVKLGFGDVNFFVTHWSYARGQGQISNALETLEFTNSYLGGNKDEGIQVLVADFNIYPDYTAPVDFLTGKRELNGKKGNFTDVWDAAQGTSLGYTFSNLLGARLVDRADRILIREVGGKKKWSTTSAERVGWRESQPNQEPPSDHLGVVAVLAKRSV